MRPLQNSIETVAFRRKITVAALLAQVRLSQQNFNNFVQGRNKTEPSIRTCARILALQETCGLAPELPFEIDGRRVVIAFEPQS